MLSALVPLYATVFVAHLSAAHRLWARVAVGILAGLSLLLLSGGLQGLILGGERVNLALLPEFATELDVRLPALLLALTGSASLALLVTRVRARVIHLLRLRMHPDEVVHTVALLFALWLMGSTLSQIALTVQLPDGALAELSAVTQGEVWESGIALGLLAVLGVGLGLRRSVAESLERLALARPTLRQLGVALAVISAIAVWQSILLVLWQVADPDSFSRIMRASEGLFAARPGVLEIVGLATIAGVGEELLYRGALQPRFGLWLTSLLFALSHPQFELSPALLGILVVGIVLGVVRRIEGTATSMLVHVGYNIVVALLAVTAV